MSKSVEKNGREVAVRLPYDEINDEINEEEIIITGEFEKHETDNRWITFFKTWCKYSKNLFSYVGLMDFELTQCLGFT